MNRPALPLALVILLVLTGCASPPDIRAQSAALLERTTDGSRYTVWQPEGYEASRAWPLIVFLHGTGECGTDGLRQAEVGLGPALRKEPGRWPFVVLMPQKPDKGSMWEDHLGMILVELNEVRREFRIDEDRIYLTGLSRGGKGTWAIAAEHPDAWAAIVPICGYGDEIEGAEVAMLPIWAFHGADDDIVPPDKSVMLIEAARMERARRRAAGLPVPGPEPRLTIYPETNHNSWDRAYAEPDLPGWLLGCRRSIPQP